MCIAFSTVLIAHSKEKNSTDLFAVFAGLSISANKVKISNMVNRQTATELICNLRWISRNQKEKIATKNQNKDLEGRYNNFFLLKLKPHILDSNGVWLSSFWSEGSINPLNLKMLVKNFIPWVLRKDLEWQQEGPRMAAGKDVACCPALLPFNKS